MNGCIVTAFQLFPYPSDIGTVLMVHCNANARICRTTGTTYVQRYIVALSHIYGYHEKTTILSLLLLLVCM